MEPIINYHLAVCGIGGTYLFTASSWDAVKRKARRTMGGLSNFSAVGTKCVDGEDV